MKIALISMPRVGSHDLYGRLKFHYKNKGIWWYHEPYRFPEARDGFDLFNLEGGILYKGLIYHCPVEWKNRNLYECDKTLVPNNVKRNLQVDEDDNVSWCKTNWYNVDDGVIKFLHKVNQVFDKVIYLDGLDMDRIVKSYMIATLTKEWHKKTDYSIDYSNHDGYFVSQEEDEKYWRNHLMSYQEILRYYANDENYFTYEGLYKNKSERDKLKDYLSGKNLFQIGTPEFLNRRTIK